MKKGTNTIFFIPKIRVLKHKKVTYIRILCAIRLKKSETHQVQITAGENLVEFYSINSTPTAAIETIKMHWNSVISIEGAKYCTIDLKNFFLQAKLKDFKYIRILFNIILPNFIVQYNLGILVHTDRYVYAEVRGGIYSSL